MIIPPTESSLNTKTLGLWGEQLVSEWLHIHGWQILQSRWRCRWGELDVVALRGEDLAFVEVKTRCQGSWDAGGLLAVAAAKQAKLCKAALCFLEQFPDLALCACRFDVALVSYRRCLAVEDGSQGKKTGLDGTLPGSLPYTVQIRDYQLTLADYLPAAFTPELS